MAQDGKKKDIFPFFDLPLEMRDAVYDNLIEDLQHVQLLEADSEDIDACIIDGIVTHALLVCKQMKEEYEKRGRKRMKLHLSDHGCFDWKKPVLTERLLDIHSIDITIMTTCDGDECYGIGHCHARDEIEQHHEWLVPFLQQLKPETSVTIRLILAFRPVDVSFTLTWPQLVHGNDQSLDSRQVERLTDSMAVSKIELYAISDPTRSHFYMIEEEDVAADRLFASWKRGTGWKALEGKEVDIHE